MALHRLTSATIGVPNVSDTVAYNTEFGLTPEADGWLATRDGGRQLRVVTAPTRRLAELHVGVDDPTTSTASPAKCAGWTCRSNAATPR